MPQPWDAPSRRLHYAKAGALGGRPGSIPSPTGRHFILRSHGLQGSEVDSAGSGVGTIGASCPVAAGAAPAASLLYTGKDNAVYRPRRLFIVSYVARRKG
jgi:hypothetical protein